jgi:ribose/xylose/arabinose/galactoside ABC-type transport system permease subunit
MKTLMHSKLFWPLVMLFVVLLFNLIVEPNFFRIEIKNGHLFGSLIDILNRGAPLMLVSIGMTMVIATKGIDLSVGSVIAMAAAIAAMVVGRDGVDSASLLPLFIAIGVALCLSLFSGLWNGFLVSYIGIQPIVATLILMVAGRGIAQLITGGQITTIYYKPFYFMGAGYFLMLPFSIFIVLFFLLAAHLLSRKTALGLFIEAVGSNPTATRLAGINSRVVTLMVYIFCGLCAGVAGLIISSNVASADGNNLGLWFELDAILAVVIGGTSLMGGRFYLMGTIIGALIIQSLTTTIYSIGVPPEITLVIKAIVVLIVCLVQSDSFRKKITSRNKPQKTSAVKEVTG